MAELIFTRQELWLAGLLLLAMGAAENVRFVVGVFVIAVLLLTACTHPPTASRAVVCRDYRVGSPVGSVCE